MARRPAVAPSYLAGLDRRLADMRLWLLAGWWTRGKPTVKKRNTHRVMLRAFAALSIEIEIAVLGERTATATATRPPVGERGRRRPNNRVRREKA